MKSPTKPQLSLPAWRQHGRMLALAVVVLVAGATSALAQITVYENESAFDGGAATRQGFLANGGMMTLGGTTSLVGDDITFKTGYAGAKVTSYTLAVGNVNTSPTTATLTVEFFSTNGTGGGPGTLLGSASTTQSFGTGVSTTTFTASSLFTIPASGQIWAGYYFSGGAVSDMNNLGGTVETGGTIGTSNASTLFFGSGMASAPGSNPSGSIGANPNSGQVSNIGMVFIVPEPSSVTAMALGAVACAAFVLRRRMA